MERSSWIRLWYHHLSNVKLHRDTIYAFFLLAYVQIFHICTTLLLPGVPCYYFFPVQFPSHHLLWKMALAENVFQAQTENLVQFQNYYLLYWKIKSSSLMSWICSKSGIKTMGRHELTSFWRLYCEHWTYDTERTGSKLVSAET